MYKLDFNCRLFKYCQAFILFHFNYPCLTVPSNYFCLIYGIFMGFMVFVKSEVLKGTTLIITSTGRCVVCVHACINMPISVLRGDKKKKINWFLFQKSLPAPSSCLTWKYVTTRQQEAAVKITAGLGEG